MSEQERIIAEAASYGNLGKEFQELLESEIPLEAVKIKWHEVSNRLSKAIIDCNIISNRIAESNRRLVKFKDALKRHQDTFITFNAIAEFSASLSERGSARESACKFSKVIKEFQEICDAEKEKNRSLYKELHETHGDQSELTLKFKSYSVIFCAMQGCHAQANTMLNIYREEA